MASSTDLQRMYVLLELRQRDLDRSAAAAERRINRLAGNVDRSTARAARNMQRNLAGSSFRGLASAIAAVEGPLGGTASRFRSFNAVIRDVGPATAVAAVGLGALAIGASQVIGLADKFTRFENRLKTAGLEGENLAAVGDRLFTIANRNGVEIEALGSVYARASLAAKELGATQENLDTFVGAVSDALRVQGSSAEAARGALLQLSQALGQDIVRAEEFNSILEGALPIAQAAARGIARFEGSVAKLRKAIINGEVTSKEFFEGILKDAPNLAAQAAKANLTLENSFTALYNQLARGIGQTDKALGASERLSQGIVFLANNLDTLGQALGVIVGALGARLTAALGASAVAAGRNAIATVRGAIADRDAAKAALDRARAQNAAAVVARNDANAQFARAAAVRQATILENQYQQALLRRRAAAGLQTAFSALSGVVGGPLGIGLTALAGTYLIVANRTQEAAERTRNLESELRKLGYLAPEVAEDAENAAEAIAKMTSAQLREQARKFREEWERLGQSNPIQNFFASIFGLDVQTGIGDIIFAARGLAREMERLEPDTAAAAHQIAQLASDLKDGAITGDEFAKRIAAIKTEQPNARIDKMTVALQGLADVFIAAGRAADDFSAKAEKAGDTATPRFDAARQSAGRSGLSLGAISLLNERARIAALDEEAKAIERRADAIQKEAEQAKVAISRHEALNRARREIAIEKGVSDRARLAEDMAKSAERDAEIVSELQKAIATFGDERAQAIDRAAASLSAYASPEQIKNVKELAAALYDLGVAESQREAHDDSGAAARKLDQLRQEGELIGLVGAKLAEREFYQTRLNEKLAAGINLVDIDTAALQREAEAFGRNAAAIIKANEAKQNAIEIQDGLRQGLIDVGLAATRGADDFSDAVGNMLRRIADLIIELYVLKPLVESIFGAMGSSGGGSVGGLIGGLLGFANGGVMTSTGPRALPRYARGGVSNTAAIFGEAGPEAAVPLPDGRRIPVDLRIPNVPASASKIGGQTVFNVSVDARGASDPVAVEAAVRRGVNELRKEIPSLAVSSVAAAKVKGGSTGRALR